MRRSAFFLAQLLDDPREPLRNLRDTVDRKPVGQMLPGAVPLLGDGHRHAAERRLVKTARNMQLVYQEKQDVELANAAETAGDLAKTASEAPRRARLQLQHGHELPQPPRRNAGPVKRHHLSLFKTLQGPRQPIEAFSEELRSDEHGWSLNYS